MARLAERLPENVPGEFYVDRSCIDCETCRVVAPALFARADSTGMSFVRRQPAGAEEQARAAAALVSCPTASIGTASKLDVRPGVALLPEPIAPDVSEIRYCGFAGESSFGAASYLVLRPDGNVLVDTPRPARPLLDRFAALGGVRLHFLTHRDDVGAHAAFRRRFGGERILHRADLLEDTRDVERPLDGDEPVRLTPDLLAIPVPGHTPGSAALLFRDRFLFTGDHLFAAEDGRGLHASRGVCWYSWPAQVRSLERLLAFDFEWVLPGHGARFRAASPAAMRDALERLLGRLRRRA